MPGVHYLDDLYTVGSARCSTLREAAELRGLLESDTEYDLVLQEASAINSGFRIRQLFAYILV